MDFFIYLIFPHTSTILRMNTIIIQYNITKKKFTKEIINKSTKTP